MLTVEMVTITRGTPSASARMKEARTAFQCTELRGHNAPSIGTRQITGNRASPTTALSLTSSYTKDATVRMEHTKLSALLEVLFYTLILFPSPNKTTIEKTRLV